MSEKLKIVYRPLQELSPYAHNARTHSTEQVAQLVESIKQFGWTNPVLIDEKGEIIAGYGRVTALEEENTTLRQNLATADTRISTLENQVSELVALVRQLTGSEH
ncbi:ParB/Srx family N-terminal domain-containing protein [Escherichia coli]